MPRPRAAALLPATISDSHITAPFLARFFAANPAPGDVQRLLAAFPLQRDTATDRQRVRQQLVLLQSALDTLPASHPAMPSVVARVLRMGPDGPLEQLEQRHDLEPALLAALDEAGSADALVALFASITRGGQPYTGTWAAAAIQRWTSARLLAAAREAHAAGRPFTTHDDDVLVRACSRCSRPAVAPLLPFLLPTTDPSAPFGALTPLLRAYSETTEAGPREWLAIADAATAPPSAPAVHYAVRYAVLTEVLGHGDLAPALDALPALRRDALALAAAGLAAGWLLPAGLPRWRLIRLLRRTIGEEAPATLATWAATAACLATTEALWVADDLIEPPLLPLVEAWWRAHQHRSGVSWPDVLLPLLSAPAAGAREWALLALGRTTL